MQRSEIPWRLAAARGATIARIPGATLAKMAPCDLAPRLLAHDALIRKARVPHLDRDLYCYRVRMATDALTETDPRQLAAIMKAAGVPWSGHEPMTGTHSHAHPAYGSQGGDANHEHEHTHRGDANHRHSHASAKSAKSVTQLAADAVRRAAGQLRLPDGTVYTPRPAVSGALAKAPRSVTVPTPALDEVSGSRSLADGLTKLQRQGRLGQAAAELGRVAEADASLRGVSKAAEYEAKAARMTCAEDRQAYLELARAERAKAGQR